MDRGRGQVGVRERGWRKRTRGECETMPVLRGRSSESSGMGAGPVELVLWRGGGAGRACLVAWGWGHSLTSRWQTPFSWQWASAESRSTAKLWTVAAGMPAG